MQFFNRIFNRQTVAVPARDVLRIKPRQLLGLDDHVFQHFVECMANVQLAVGVRRTIVQHKQGCTTPGHAQFFVQALAVPILRPLRLTLGQVAAHRERRVHHVDAGVGVVGFVVHIFSNH